MSDVELVGVDPADPWLPTVVKVHANRTRVADDAGLFDSSDVEGVLAELQGNVDDLVISGGGISTASTSETIAGTSTTKAVTPAGWMAASLVDAGQGWAAKRAVSQANEVWAVLGDSTGNETTEWVYLLAQQQAVDVGPQFRVEYRLWNDTTQAYDATVLVQDGISTPIVAVDDTFTGTGDLYGSVPDTAGGGWSGPTGAAGVFTRGGGVITKTAGIGGLTSDGGVLGTKTVDATTVVMNTLNTGVVTQFGVGIQVDTQNNLYVYVNISASGSRSWGIGQRLNNTFTVLVNGVNTDIPANAAATFDMQLTVVGTAVTGTVNAHTVSATLTAPAQTMFDTARQCLVTSTQTGTGFTVSRVKMTVQPTAATARRLRIYNAAMPGSTLAYHIPKLAAMIPEPVDLLWISSGHNYGTDTGPVLVADIDTVVASVRGAAPVTGIIVSGQNPQYPPAAGGLNHRSRQAAVRAHAKRHRYGHVPVWESFATLGAAGVQSDGVHPNTTGSALWRDTSETYLRTLLAAKAANPGTATGTDAAVINNIVTILRNLGLVT